MVEGRGLTPMFLGVFFKTGSLSSQCKASWDSLPGGIGFRV